MTGNDSDGGAENQLDAALRDIRRNLGLDKGAERELYFLNALFMLQPIILKLYIEHGDSIPEIASALGIVTDALYGDNG